MRILALLLIFGSSPAFAGTNLLTNSGFESPAAPAEAMNWCEVKDFAATNAAQFHAGSQSTLISTSSGDTGTDGGYYQDVPIDNAACTYTFCIWIRGSSTVPANVFGDFSIE